MDLYRKYRPQSLDSIEGQENIVNSLRSWLSDLANFPHVILFKGPTGTGKTTLAEYVARQLVINEEDIVTSNCADKRDIDSAREIAEKMRYKGWGGGNRVWILDEIIQLPKATQQALLGTLENHPEWVYFIGTASDTTSMLPTFLSRFKVLNLQLLKVEELQRVMERVLTLEKRYLSQNVINEIITKSEGSARKALQILEVVLTSEDEGTQLQLAGAASLDQEQQIDFLARMFFKRSSYASVIPIINRIDLKDVEGIRLQVLDYAYKVITNPTSKQDWKLAKLVISCFENSFRDSGKAGLAVACYAVAEGSNTVNPR